MKTKRLSIRMAVTSALAALMTWIPLLTHAAPSEMEARLARVFQDNMVLQREKPVPIWGWAKPGTQVEVSFGGQKKPGKADEKGYWKVILDPMKASSAPQVLTAQIGTTTATRKNVLVGEVWIAVGHSGTVCGGPNVDTGLYPHCDVTMGAGKPEVRVFMIIDGASMEPYADLDPAVQGGVKWVPLKEDAEWPNQIDYFARMLRDRLNVPVGILHPLCLGVVQPTWMPRETLEAIPAESGSGNCFQAAFAACDARLAKLGGKVKSWADFQKAEAEWKKTRQGTWNTAVGGGIPLYSYPSGGYNAKVYPLAPYAIKGVQFFAGPTVNTGGAAGVAAMVKQWRKLFGQDFYFVNCASGNRVRTSDQPYLAPAMLDNPSEDAIYDSLKLFSGEKREEVVNTKDLGTWLAHNYERAEAGRRLCLATLALAYGEKLLADGATPRVADLKILGNKAVVRFSFVGDGMSYQPSIDGISGVYLRGKSGTARWAQVKVLGKDTVEFSHPDIADLETVSYGEAVNSHETLFNSAGLPSAPFVLNPPPPLTRDLPQPKGASRPPAKMLSFQGGEQVLGKNGLLSLAHVRRSGYVFQFITNVKPEPASTGSTVPVTAYIPAEWKGYEVIMGDTYWIRECYDRVKPKTGLIRSGGQVLKTTESTKDGNRLVTFDAPLDGTWIIVAEKGKAADFRKINRY